MTVYDAISQIRTQSNQGQTVGSATKDAAAKRNSDVFSQFLANAMGADSDKQNTSGSVEGSAPVAPLDLPAASPDAAVSAINDLLSALEDYEEALGDSSMSLKDMEPLVGSMEEKLQALQSETSDINDSELKDLANFALTQATVESIKFRRGDYV